MTKTFAQLVPESMAKEEFYNTDASSILAFTKSATMLKLSSTFRQRQKLLSSSLILNANKLEWFPTPILSGEVLVILAANIRVSLKYFPQGQTL